MAENIQTGRYLDLANNTVKFLSGSQASLNNYITNGGAQEGAFYLTNDTHRLYVGREKATDNKIYPVPVNEGITTVATASLLSNQANVGDFYYIEEGNILAVCTGATGTGAQRETQWAQLNANTDTALTGMTYAVAQSGNNAAVSQTYTIDVNGTQTTQNGGGFTLIPGDNISYTVDSGNNTITITAAETTYTLGITNNASKGVISLTPSRGTGTNVNIEGTGNNVLVSGSGSGANQKITVAVDEVTGISATTGAGTQGWSLTAQVHTVDGSDVNTTATAFDPTITIGAGSGAVSTTDNNTTSTVHFVNGNAILDVYSKNQTDLAISQAIEGQLRGLDAMTFKGTISSASDVPALTAVHNGDTYKVVEDITVNGVVTAKTGDLIIAKGTENTSTGLLQPGGEWVVVPSGDDPTLTFAQETHGFSASETVNGVQNTTKSLQFTVDAGNLITVTDDNTAVTGVTTSKKVTVAHATVTRTDTNGTAISVPDDNTSITFYALGDTRNASTGTWNASEFIVTDSYGHVTGVKGRKVTIQDTHANIQSVTVATSAASTASASFAVTVADSDARSATGNLNIQSSTLSLGVDSNNTYMTVDLKWGSF